jgi:hypothetical protein
VTRGLGKLLYPDVVAGVGREPKGQSLAVGRQGPPVVFAKVGKLKFPARIDRRHAPVRSTHTMENSCPTAGADP